MNNNNRYRFFIAVILLSCCLFNACSTVPIGKDTVLDLPHVHKLEMLWVKPGSFIMGLHSIEIFPGGTEEAQHQVTLPNGYWLGKTEVTQGQWESVMGSNPSKFKASGSNAPVEMVSWEDIDLFCKKLTERERSAGRLPAGYEYRLPTETEWEYACRAGTTGPYAGELDGMAWYRENSHQKTHSVGQKLANAWGFYDMHGNVSEWCSDLYSDDPSSNIQAPSGPSSGSVRVVRGGDWSGNAWDCRSTVRDGDIPGDRRDMIGFRLALSPVR